MKLTAFLCLFTSVTALASTEERISKHLPVQAGGNVVIDVDFGSITVTPTASPEVVVDAWRKVTRKTKAAETEFFKSNPVEITQNGNTVTIRSRHPVKAVWSFWGSNRSEGKYVINVPAQFSANLKTAGGEISVRDLTGDMKVHTSGGGLQLSGLHGPLEGNTSGGAIRVTDCAGEIHIKTSGGGIDVAGGSGTLEGHTSGGSVTVKNFHGSAHVETSGGGIELENIAGEIKGSTSAGAVSAVLVTPLTGPVNLSTTAGSVTVRVAENAAFDLDASTSAGGVGSDLPVTVVGKTQHSRLKGIVNGGGQPVILRTSAGGIHVHKL
jgi:DUF4097 and DUF4098 domain-containing protein YvlB